jgi:hypothetical protein
MGETTRPLEGPVTAESVLASEHGTEILASVVASSLGRGVVYAAVRAQDGSGVDGLVVLFEQTGNHLHTRGLWEWDGPNKDECPAGILKLLTEPRNEHAREWRERCRARLDRPKPKPGDVIVFAEPVEFNDGKTYERLTFRGHSRFEDENGMPYSVPNWRKRDYRIERPETGKA